MKSEGNNEIRFLPLVEMTRHFFIINRRLKLPQIVSLSHDGHKGHFAPIAKRMTVLRISVGRRNVTQGSHSHAEAKYLKESLLNFNWMKFSREVFLKY
jgi:hypothetical protein